MVVVSNFPVQLYLSNTVDFIEHNAWAEISKKIIPGCTKAICALVETLTTASVSGVSVNG